MKQLLLILLFSVSTSAYTQQTFSITDSMPAVSEGLKAGYDITGASEKEVGNKGNFSRYKIHFYITNTSTQAKMILYKPNSSIFGSGTSPNIIQFKCINATGARMTSKEFTLQAKPCIIDALVEETDAASGKTVQNKKPANIGYWIKPGETLASNSVVIVPLNERPNVIATFFPGTTNIPGTVINNDNNNNPEYIQPSATAKFVRIKNFSNNNYLHNQSGPISCSGIDYNWWSAQWEILPVNGTSYFQIRNRWKNNFISTENASLLSDNGQLSNAMWLIDENGSNNTYTIRNAASNAKLVYQDGLLKTTTFFGNQPNMQWIIEQ